MMQFLRVATTLLAFVVVLGWVGMLPAQPVSTSTVSQDEPIPSEVESAPTLDDRLRYEREALERQADRQMGAVLHVVDLGFRALGFLAVVGLGFVFWWFGSTRAELRKSVESAISKQVQDLVVSQADGVRERVAAIEHELKDLASFRERIVTWVLDEESPASNEVLSAMRARGFESVNVVIPDDASAFEIGRPDLTIVSYDASDGASRRLAAVLVQLAERVPAVPVIVYTFSADGRAVRIHERDEPALARYRWYVPANFPLQLLSQVSTLIGRARTGANR